jgi:CBS domain-containing protein
MEVIVTTNVADILRKKGKDVYSVSPDTALSEALKVMSDKGVGALMVLEKDELVGIISERDFVRQISKLGKCDLSAPVKEFMTRLIYGVSPKQTIGECMALMTDRHIRHLPVKDGSKLVGMISIGDVVKEIIAERDYMIANLENYMFGR